MKILITFTCLILLSCGGGGGSNPTPDPTDQINFIGTGGDFQAAQPIDID